MHIIQHKEVEINNPNSRITFETTGSESWPLWDRYIALDKEQVVHIGNVCNTCAFFFHKQARSLDISYNEEQIIHSLNNRGISLSEEEVNKLSALIPNGKYSVLRSIVKPQLVQKGSTDDYFSNERKETWAIAESGLVQQGEYYRESLIDFGRMEFDHKDAFFNFFIPLYDINNVSQSRVDHYKSVLQQGVMPTAVAIGVLDVKTSEDYAWVDGVEVEPEYGTHWCLANYLVDGHHKIKAASELGIEVGLITFVFLGNSVGRVDTMFSQLDKIHHPG